MKVRYKWGKFTYPVAVSPGDRFTCNLNEEFLEDGVVVTKTQTVSEEITKAMTISHWVMFYIPGVESIGGIFGNEDTVKKIGEIFCDPEEVNGQSLIV